MIEPVDVPLAEFPSSDCAAAGMITLTADLTPRYGTALLGVPYADRSGYPLHLQVLLPPMAPDSVETFPCILYVQGSAWFPQNLGQELPGGHTTVHTYLDPEPLGLGCAVDFYGPTDISRMNEEPSIMDHSTVDSPEGTLIGGHPVLERPDLVAPTIAMKRVPTDRPLPPLLIMHGSRDRLVPFGQSVLLYEAMVAAGQPVTLYRLESSDHGGPAFWQPPILDIVDAFLCASLA